MKLTVADEDMSDTIMEMSKLTPYKPQLDVIIASKKQLSKYSAVILAADMSCGKTLMGVLSVALTQTPQRHLVMCPPHLVRKWVAEVNKVLPRSVAKSFTISGKDCLKKLREIPDKKPAVHEFYVASRERWKMGYSWRHTSGLIKKPVKNDGEIYFKRCCPKCGSQIDYGRWKEGRKNFCTEELVLNKNDKNSETRVCGEALWQADNTKKRRFSPAEYVSRYVKKNAFHTLIADEIQELKGESAQGVAFGQLAGKCKNVIGLTGTLTGGYADDIFYLLWRMFPSQMKQNKLSFYGKKDWLEKYGVLERVYKATDEENKSSRSMRLTNTKRKPGISPEVLSRFIIPNSIFMKLHDLEADLPGYREEVHEIEMDSCVEAEYLEFESDLQEALKKALKAGDRTLLGRMLQSLLAWPDACRKTETVLNGFDQIVATALGQSLELTAKESYLISLVQNSIDKGRKVLIYAEFTGTRDIATDLSERLESKGLRPLILRSSVKAEKRALLQKNYWN